MNEFESWLKNATEPSVSAELASIEGNNSEIEDRFYSALTFGTGGLRGVLGAGTNRMNVYTVGRATMGLADYLTETGGKSAVIAYDSRNRSEQFARLSAEILSSAGIHAYLFSELTPTPVLSFAVRHLKASAGIVITASHNPKEYNGYKVYNEKGCQITDDAAKKITEKISGYGYFHPFTKNEALITVLDDSVKRAFLDTVKALSRTKITESNAPAVVYSPLHGAGRKYVEQILEEIGVSRLRTVEEQAIPDGSFPTCPFPNPEERSAWALALRDAKLQKPDLVMLTDPDADRIGIAVPDSNGEYVLLNGNETGSILLYYAFLTAQKTAGATVIKTIVTTDIVFGMARKFGATVKEVLTGFKYIGEAMEETEHYLLGLEESYGYLVGTHARDKDAVSAAMMITEACAYFKEQGKALLDVLSEIRETYGYYQTSLLSFSAPGRDGLEKMRNTIAALRKHPPTHLDGEALTAEDFSKGIYGLPKSAVLRFASESYRIIVRPSGTEPKMKVYLEVRGTSETDAHVKLAKATEKVHELISL